MSRVEFWELSNVSAKIEFIFTLMMATALFAEMLENSKYLRCLYPKAGFIC
jgi:hypothetical protein